jgi:hypothetical protein
MDPTLWLHPGQTRLTPDQEVEVVRFAEAYIRAQLSTEPANEREAEALLKQAYEVAGLAAPRQIYWLDGPFQLIATWVPEGIWDGVHPEPVMRLSLWDTVEASALENVWERFYTEVSKRVEARLRSSFPKEGYWDVYSTIRGIIRFSPRSPSVWIRNPAWNNADYLLWRRARRNVWQALWSIIGQTVTDLYRSSRDQTARPSIPQSGLASISAYQGDILTLACAAFFDTYFAPNDLHALAHFNQLVSGYWLGQEVALLVRRPQCLSFDAAGRLHSGSGPCIEYHDGWGFWAWHGVRVSEKVILAPEALTRDDFLGERNLEVRRVIQERMGSRFVSELGGGVLDSSPRGTLYEVVLPDDPERVARYVQVHDASTERQYLLRVPPTVQTAAEAVAWSFQMTVEEYAPAHET